MLVGFVFVLIAFCLFVSLFFCSFVCFDVCFGASDGKENSSQLLWLDGHRGRMLMFWRDFGRSKTGTQTHRVGN